MDSLGKISIIISIIGIIALLFTIRTYNFNLVGGNNLTQENIGKSIELQGRVIDYRKFENSFLITLDTKCKISTFYYDKKQEFTKEQIEELIGKEIIITGVLQKGAIPELNIEELEIV